MTQTLGALEIAGYTHPGQVRELNEDAWAFQNVPSGDLFLVADGMGGHRSGEVASNMAVQTLVQTMRDMHGIPPESLPRALQRSNLAVFQHASRSAESRGMGTTMTAAIIDGNAAIIGHVGDSRAYLIRGGKIEQLTRDHSWVAERVRQGLLTEEEARDHKWRNVITNALGSRPQLRLDLFGLDLRENDILLLCSDGLSNMVEDGTLLRVVLEHAFDSAEDIAHQLTDLANAAGGLDNITCVIARVRRLGPRSKPYPLPVLATANEAASEEIGDDTTSTIIYEGDAAVKSNRQWLLPLAVVLYGVLVAVLLLMNNR
jgi:PPM family protein phosphatase